MDDAGQSALFDAFLFFVIALVASAAVLSYASLSFASDETSRREQVIAYAEDVRVALMRTTLEDPWYVNRTGARVDLGQGVTVERFLLDEIQLLAAGVLPENFAVTNAAVRQIANSLVRPPFAVGLEITLAGNGASATLWLGDGSGPPPDRFTSAWAYDSATGAALGIAVHLWYA